MGTRRSKGSWVKRVVDTAHGRDTATRPAQGGGFSMVEAAAKSGQFQGLQDHMDKQKAEYETKTGSTERPGGPLSLVGAASKSNPAIAQSLKIAKEKAPQQKKKPLSLAKTVATPKKKLTGAKPASAVAGALGSSSGGSVRL